MVTGRPTPLPGLPLTFTFDRAVLSQNRTTYAHWSSHHKDKRSWEKHLLPQLGPYQGLLLRWSSWRLTRVYAGRCREYDYANLIGGAKPLIDLLIEMRILIDDSPGHFLCDYVQEPGDANQTILTLLEVSDGRPTDDLR